MKVNEFMTDRVTGVIGTIGTFLATYAGEPILAAAIAILTFFALLPKGAAGAYKAYRWVRGKLSKK